MPGAGGITLNKVCSASTPPENAPTPTIGNGESMRHPQRSILIDRDIASREAPITNWSSTISRLVLLINALDLASSAPRPNAMPSSTSDKHEAGE